MKASEEIEPINQVNTTNILTNGLQAGIFMIAFWLAFRTFFPEVNTMWQYAGYIILIPFIYRSVTKHKLITEQGKRFQNGIKIGFQVSVVAALAVGLINLIVATIAPDLAITKFNKEITDVFVLLAVNFGLILEIIVIGMLITFIVLQSQKDSSSSRKND